MGELPLEIWADMLEDEGQDTADLRAWIAMSACGSGDCPVERGPADYPGCGMGGYHTQEWDHYAASGGNGELYDHACDFHLGYLALAGYRTRRGQATAHGRYDWFGDGNGYEDMAVLTVRTAGG